LKDRRDDTALTARLAAAALDPLDLYEELCRGAAASDTFLLESALRNRTTGRFSLIGFGHDCTFTARGRRIEIRLGDETVRCQADPVDELQRILDARRREDDAMAPFAGGAVGYFSYDLSRQFHPLPARNKEPSGIPDIHLIFCRDFIVFDHTRKTASVVSYYDPRSSAARAAAERKLAQVRTAAERAIRGSCLLGPSHGALCAPPPITMRPNMTRGRYISMVKRAKEYIGAGDIYQANLSQRLDVTAGIGGLQIYRALRQVNPSPFASYLRFGGCEVIGCSPERLVRREGDFIETRPIAGTRPRGQGRREDFMMRSELLLSEKERAEHIMLVDLERNDLGRVARTGSVEVDECMAVEPYSHVQHIVSNVRAILDPRRNFADILRAVFPGGTITGVPKIRCMEIIDELEPSYRGLYTGSIGYISDSGDLDLNIVIRTIVKRGAEMSIQVGAGIVADSDPAREYDETMHKAEALIAAIRGATAHKSMFTDSAI